MWGGTVRKYNQYTQDIIDYNNEHGTDIFLEYKQESTSDERKKEIEDWLFNLLRERGEVPKLLWNDNEIASSLIRLSNADSSETYQDGVFGFNSSGIDVLYQFFPEINDVRKQSCPDSINDYFNKDSRLRRVLRKSLQYADSELGIYRMFLWCGAGYCVNFRPATAKALYEIYGIRGGQQCKVLDTSSGYGARLLGAHFAENVCEYVGIDPNTAGSCMRLAEYLNKNFDTGTKEIVYEILAEEMDKSTRERKQKLLRYILNNKQGITNLYKYQKELHGCSAEGHISHLYSARLSSRPLGWKTINVNNVSKLRLVKADNKEISEIVHNKRKIIEFKEIEKIRNQANQKIKESINFKPIEIPIMKFGTTEQRKFFEQLISYKKAV